MSNKFTIGDHVRITSVVTFDGIGQGLTGVIVQQDAVRTDCFRVALDNPTEEYEKLWAFSDFLEHVRREKQPVVVITSDGETTVATKRLGKRVLGRCVAVCGRDDKFDYDTGAAIAFGRLIGADIQHKDPATPKPIKVVCTAVMGDRAEAEFTPGKCYMAEPDGPDGIKIGGDHYMHDGCRLKGRFFDGKLNVSFDPTTYARFIPFVED